MIWSTTGTMQHVLGDRLIEEGMEVRIRELCRDNAINMVGIAYLVWPLEEDEEMHMGQATLLELNGVDIPRKLSKKSTFDVIQQGFHLLVEDVSNNVRTVCSSLVCAIIKLQECLLDLRPVRIGCHGQEDVRLAPIVTDCHGVLEELIHVTYAALMAGGENNALTLLPKIHWSTILVAMKSIMEALIQISTYLLLMSPDPVQIALLNRCPGIHQILLKELATAKDGVWLREARECAICIVALLGHILGAHLTIWTWL